MGLKTAEKDAMRREADAVLIAKFKPQLPEGRRNELTPGLLQFLGEYVFGNIALMGEFYATEWEDVELVSGPFIPEVGGFHTKVDLEVFYPGEEGRPMTESAIKFKVNFAP